MNENTGPESGMPNGKKGVGKIVWVILGVIAAAVIAGIILLRSTPQPEGGLGLGQPAPMPTTNPTTSATPTPALEPTPGATPSATPAAADATKAVDLSTDAAGLSKAVVVMKTNKGILKFRLYSNDAPNSVKRFVELIQSKFYDGLLFHRVVPGFVVQVGDPKSKSKDEHAVGTGGSGVKLKAEFNNRRHIRGTVAMARAADPDSADSQFYFSLGTFQHLDNKYTVIGQVVDFGEKIGDKDVLDRIRQWDEIVDMHIE